MVALGLPDFGPVQNNISFNDRGRHDPRHPRRAVGQVGLVATGRIFGAWVDLRAGPLRHGLHPRARPGDGDLRAARGRQRATRRSSRRHRVHLPGQRPLDPRRAGLHVPQPRRRDRGDRLADPARAGRALGEADRAPSAARRRHARCRPRGPCPRRRAASSAGRCTAAAAGRASDCDPRRARPRATRPRSAPSTGASYDTSSTRPPTPPSTPPRRRRAAGPRGPPTSPPSAPGRARRREHRLTAGARVDRLRLRRHRRAAPRGRAVLPLGVYGQTKAAGDAAGGHRCRGTTSSAPAG